MRGKRRVLILYLLFGMLLSLLCGCGAPAEEGGSVLWIVTEQSTWDRMNGQLEVLKEAYEAAHEGVTIRVDCLPTNAQERDVRLQQLRTEILQGGGPDCYLLPIGNTLILDEPAQYTYVEIEPFFPDVELAMRNGLLCDITRYYDADEALDKESLNTAVMDAGVADGARYVLPLRYDIPVIYAQNEVLAEAGLDPAVLSEDIFTIMEAVCETGDPRLAGGVLCRDLSAFSDFIDYRTGNASLDAQTLRRYMELYQKLTALLGGEYLDLSRVGPGREAELTPADGTTLLEKLDIRAFIYGAYTEANAPRPSWEKPAKAANRSWYPLWIGSLQDAFDYVPLSRYTEDALTILPLRAAGSGDVVATVRYYAAVGSGCDDPALAYDFLRQFLLEDSQWEYNRPVREHTKPIRAVADNTSNDLQYPGLIESGWPVRDKNSVETLWGVRKKQVYVRSEGRGGRMRKIGLMRIEEENIPLFDVPIGQVRFNTTLSDTFAEVLSRLNDPDSGYTPAETDLEKTAQLFCWDLRWHVSEG